MKLVWSGNKIPIDMAAVKAGKVGVVRLMNRLYAENEMYHYRGFTVMSMLDEIDEDYSAVVKRGLFLTPLELTEVRGHNSASELFSVSRPNREESLRLVREHIDRVHAKTPGKKEDGDEKGL